LSLAAACLGVRVCRRRCADKGTAVGANGSPVSCGREGLCAAHPRRPKPRTTESQHNQPVAPNLLGRDFTATAPNRKWVADITSIPTHCGWLYLVGILDV
jgi:transposase InsO family protein